MKIALYQSQREIHTVATRAAPGDLGLKSHPKDYQQKLTHHYGHPSKYRPSRNEIEYIESESYEDIDSIAIVYVSACLLVHP